MASRARTPGDVTPVVLSIAVVLAVLAQVTGFAGVVVLWGGLLVAAGAAAREERVANMVGGRVAKDAKGQDIKIKVDGIGSTPLDVIGPNGEHIYVGGRAKAKNLAN